MKKVLFFLTLFAFLIIAACTQSSENKSAMNENAPKLRHIVLFKFKDGTTPEQIKEVEQAFVSLKTKLPELVKDFEYGTNNSPEGLTQGLTHCFTLTFASEKDRDAYIPHPTHQAFVEKYAKVFVDKVTVFDYWTK